MKFSSVLNLPRRPLWLAASLLAMGSSPAWAVYSCSVTATSTGVLYQTPNPQDTTGIATLTCTREATDSATLTYRLKAENGLNVTGTQRRVKLATPLTYLRYSLSRPPGCANASTWAAPATGTTNVFTGTLSFGAALTASATMTYCLRTRVAAGGNPAIATAAAGVYTDTVNIFAQYPGTDGSPTTAVAPITYSVGVNNQCVFNSSPTAMAFNYSAFRTTALTATSSFNLRCSNALPWTVAVSPTSAAVIGLKYGITLSPSAGTGSGANQLVTLTGTMDAGQAGTCGVGTCTGTQVHTVTISY